MPNVEDGLFELHGLLFHFHDALCGTNVLVQDLVCCLFFEELVDRLHAMSTFDAMERSASAAR